MSYVITRLCFYMGPVACTVLTTDAADFCNSKDAQILDFENSDEIRVWMSFLLDNLHLIDN